MKPDAVIRNGRIINVFTDEIQEGLMIVIKDGIIASIEEDRDVPAYAGVEVIDAKGEYLSPGFIDAHNHLDAVYTFQEFFPYAIRGGATTVVSRDDHDRHELRNEGAPFLRRQHQGLSA